MVDSMTLITIGAILALGTIAEALGRQTSLPRVTLLLFFGFLIGPSGFHLLPKITEQWFPFIANISISMIGFLVGGKLTIPSLKKLGPSILWISVIGTITTIILIFSGLVWLNIPTSAALILAAIASATAPTTTSDVILETKAEGNFTETLFGVVALDEVWAMMAFSVFFVLVSYDKTQITDLHLFFSSLWSIVGSVLIGIILGVPMAFLTGRLQKGEPTLSEAISIVFICSGISFLLHTSFILSSLVLGFVVTNLAKHHKRPFHAIEDIEYPFLVLFFVLSGASLKFENLIQIGAIGIIYILLRILGRFSGAWLGGYVSKSDMEIRKLLGFALLPQAGVALGMALVTAQNFPKIGAVVLPIILGTTIIFELIGPILIRKMLIKTDEASLKS